MGGAVAESARLSGREICEPEGDSFSGTDHLQPLDLGSPLCSSTLAGSSSEMRDLGLEVLNLLDSWREAMWEADLLPCSILLPSYLHCRLP